MGGTSQMFVHSVAETGRLLPSASRWNSVEIDLGPAADSFHGYDSVLSRYYSKSLEFNLTITDKSRFKRFIYTAVAIFVLTAVAVGLLVGLLPHKNNDFGPPVDLAGAMKQALLFFDAQKSGVLPKSNPVKFRGDSGLKDGNESDSLVGGFYDSGNNVKFSFTIAYTITVLSWSVIEYHHKFEAIGELDHVKNIIRWGSDYLLKVYRSAAGTKSAVLYSQVGNADIFSNRENDITCWQRPEDMAYPRPVSACQTSAADLAGEIVAALSAASIVFSTDTSYSSTLVQASETLFNNVSIIARKQVYTADKSCGGEARNFYNSSSYYDEMVWGGTWLFFATGNFSYLEYATETLNLAVAEEKPEDNGVLYWNNKLAASAVLLARLIYFHDPGYPYDGALKNCSDMSDYLMGTYVTLGKFKTSPGGLILQKPNNGAPLQYAATAAFLSKIYSDYLAIMQIHGGDSFTVESLIDFAKSQVNYILGRNPSKMSYLVGFGDHFPKQVHHRGASIPANGKHYSCSEGEQWRFLNKPNPNVVVGAMVAGPDRDDKFLDERNWPVHTEPTLSGNAGLVAALAALLEDGSSSLTRGLDKDGLFANMAQIT